MESSTITIIISTALAASVTLIVKAIWDWLSNKNGKNEIDKVNENLNQKWKEFTELKNLILTSYVKRDEFEKHLNRFECVRDMTLQLQQKISQLEHK